MTTYTHPYTFAYTVVALLAERGWKIKSGRSSGDLGVQSYSLPDGMAVVGGRGGKAGRFDALMKLCESFATKHALPIKWDREAFKAKYSEGAEPKHQNWQQEASDPDTDPIFSGVFGSMFGARWAEEMEDAIGKKVKTPVYHKSVNGFNCHTYHADETPAGEELEERVYAHLYPKSKEPAKNGRERAQRIHEVDQVCERLRRTGVDHVYGFRYVRATDKFYHQ